MKRPFFLAALCASLAQMACCCSESLCSLTIAPACSQVYTLFATTSYMFQTAVVMVCCSSVLCRFILAEESSFFESKFRSVEFAQSDGSIDLTELDGATLQVVDLKSCVNAQVLPPRNANEIWCSARRPALCAMLQSMQPSGLVHLIGFTQSATHH